MTAFRFSGFVLVIGAGGVIVGDRGVGMVGDVAILTGACLSTRCPAPSLENECERESERERPNGLLLKPKPSENMD
jgi:hypothetical protein